MNNTAIIYLIAAVVAVTSISLWVWLIAAPAWASFARLWERLLSLALSVYVLAALIALGGGIAALVLWNLDEIG